VNGPIVDKTTPVPVIASASEATSLISTGLADHDVTSTMARSRFLVLVNSMTHTEHGSHGKDGTPVPW
jgi:hypothetical protein